jgi:Asp-tRNA(Asn)/Glu-tRNA(Gln) amidotransferase A subunit family amidase
MTAAIDAILATLVAAGAARVEEMRLPPGFETVHTDHRTIMGAEAAAYHRGRMEVEPAAYPPRIRALVEEGLAVTAHAYLEARARQEAFKRAMDGWWPESLDAVVSPAAQGGAPEAATTGDPLFHSPWSHAGVPTVTLPIGLAPDGLPLGIQMIGRRDRERTLMDIALRCEAAIRATREDITSS